MEQIKAIEIWYQDLRESHLWHGEQGLILNTAALDEREDYFEVLRVLASDDSPETKRGALSF